ncbi:MAG: preprotein translocase subunit SecA [Gallionellaceae bacterium]|nr:MAG: preprotein translocase subunit SecA [Gallionellaceae bacterium]
MSNTNALLKSGALKFSDGVCLERAEQKELPVEEYLRALLARAPQLHSKVKHLRKLVAQAARFEPEMQAMSDPALASSLHGTCAEMRRAGFTDPLVAQAFAAIREASVRTLGLRHYDVQLLGGWALLHGMIAEMETGEGKTLVATLAACTAASSGATVHIVTVNDYLAQRDAETNEPLYRFFGLSKGAIAQGMTPHERQQQYACDVVYVSNKEIVFDYLKDHLATEGALDAHYRLRSLYRPERPPSLLLRGLHVAIVDEADSILVDEARTPLIISETLPDPHGEDWYQRAIGYAGKLSRGEHFDISAHREIWITPKGEQFISELAAGESGIWSSALWRQELLEKALSALWCFQRDQHYIVEEGKVQIVDEFTGRVMPDRTWEQGLHQMIESKEGCEITGQRKTLARMTYQRFFRRYLLLGGMTGTASEIAPELRRVYDLEVMRIPTHRLSRRKHQNHSCLPTSTGRWSAIAERIAELQSQGRPVLVGTRSVEASEQLSSHLAGRGIEHTVLNARQDKQEAEIVAQAGQPGRITVATNMAGRGTDIKLAQAVCECGGLHVILTEFHESKRVDRQLFGRCARQGEPGSVEAIASLEDDLFHRYAPTLLRLAKALTAKRGTVPRWLLSLLVVYSQSMAERRNARQRTATLKQDRKLQSLLAFSGKRR